MSTTTGMPGILPATGTGDEHAGEVRLADALEQLDRHAPDGGWCGITDGPAAASRRLLERLGHPGGRRGAAADWRGIVQADEHERFAAAVARSGSGRAGCLEETVRFVHRDGSDRWIRCAFRPLPGAGGRPIGVVASCVDRTPEVELARRLDACDADRARATAALEDARRRTSRAEERLAVLEESGTTGLFEWPSLERDESWWSPSVDEMLGHARGDLPASRRALLDLVHPADRDRLERAIGRAARGGEPLDERIRLRRRTGEHRWFRMRGWAWHERAGAPGRMRGLLEDVHDGVEADRRLQRQERELREILDALPASVVCRDEAGRILQANRAAGEALGRDAATLAGRRIADLGAAAAWLAGPRGGSADSGGGRGRSSEERTLPAAGGRPARILRIDRLSMPGGEDGPGRHVVIATDVTARRRMERDLRRAVQRRQLSMAIARLGYWDLDVGTGAMSFGGGWLEHLGYGDGASPRSLDAWRELVHPGDRAAAAAALEAHLAGESEGYEIEERVRCRDGSWRWIRSVGQRLAPDPGDPRPAEVVTGVFIDIDDERRLEEDLRGRNAELERFVYTASHGLKSPIVTVLGFLSCIEEDLAAGRIGDVLSALQQVREAAQRMKLRVDDLLELGRIGRARRGRQRVSLDRVLDEVLADHAGLRGRRGATVDVDLEVVEVLGDPGEVRQVVDNLVVNALRHGGDRSVPRIRVSTCDVGAGRVLLTVDDNGPGIDPRHAERIFGLFERLARDEPGSGVGLAIVRRIAELDGGRAWVEPRPGGGARFKVSLPGVPACAGAGDAPDGDEEARRRDPHDERGGTCGGGSGGSERGARTGERGDDRIGVGHQLGRDREAAVDARGGSGRPRARGGPTDHPGRGGGG